MESTTDLHLTETSASEASDQAKNRPGDQYNRSTEDFISSIPENYWEVLDRSHNLMLSSISSDLSEESLHQRGPLILCGHPIGREGFQDKLLSILHFGFSVVELNNYDQAEEIRNKQYAIINEPGRKKDATYYRAFVECLLNESIAQYATLFQALRKIDNGEKGIDSLPLSGSENGDRELHEGEKVTDHKGTWFLVF